MPPDEDVIEVEERRWELIREWSRENARDLSLVWHRGDGCGGGLLDLMAREVRAEGYFVETSLELSARLAEQRTTPPRRRIPARVRTSVFERDQYRCRHCETHLSLTIDHITPHSQGGTDDLENLQTLCRSCNSRKGKRTEGGEL